ncbi:purine-cytosine permease family protein [Pseudonocardia spinosispora]|uniref:purine-cytosine permease family protein n=1 Tax=Pseudonocardia spinosispora TaxID=103441 RepID=UPI000416607C|nr:cytosine permease [Pseudonocardia spinosispora]
MVIPNPELAKVTDSEPKAQLLKVEQHGIDFIPYSERKMTLTSLGAYWTGTSLYYFNFVIGTTVYLLGLQLWVAFLAILTGNLLYFMVALGAIPGPRTGVPTLTLSRGAFGVTANRGNSILSWVEAVLFEILNIVFGSFAIIALFAFFGWTDSGTTGKVIAVAAVLVVSVTVATFGKDLIVWVQRFFAITVGVVSLVVIAFTVGRLDLSAQLATPSQTPGIAVFLIGAGIIASGPLLSMVMAADVARYLPQHISGRRTFWTVLVTSGGTSMVLSLLGAMLAAQADLTKNPVAGVSGLLPTWLYLLFIFAVIGSSVGNCIISLYCSALSMLAIGVPLRRWQATLVDGVLSAIGSFIILFVTTEFEHWLNNLLSLLVIWVGPWSATWLVDAFRRRWTYDAVDLHSADGGRYGRVNLSAVVATLTGALAAVLTMNAPAFQGPLSAALFGGADVAWLAGPLVAAVLYVVLPAKRVGATR